MPYGCQINKADGTPAILPEETFCRVVAIIDVARGFSGTLSVPQFDSDRGALSVFFHLFRGLDSVDLEDELSLDWYGSNQDVPYFQRPGSHHPANLPSVDWDNATKLATVAPASLPSDWPNKVNPHYRLMFFHYR